MRAVLCLVLTVVAVVGMLPTAALAATSNEVFVETDDWDEEIRCGEIEGLATGTVVQRVHLRTADDGTVYYNYNEQLHSGRLEDADGNVYRVVGAGSGSGILDPESDSQLVRRQIVNLVIIGERGVVGRLYERQGVNQHGRFGGCEFA